VGASVRETSRGDAVVAAPARQDDSAVVEATLR